MTGGMVMDRNRAAFKDSAGDAHRAAIAIHASYWPTQTSD